MHKFAMTQLRRFFAIGLMMVLPLVGLAQKRSAQNFDVIIKGGMVYDGTGRAPVRADVGIVGDKITAIGNLNSAQAKNVVDATGLAVAPGFINMLSWSVDTTIVDGRSL